jgi:3-hydroxy-9,10-secoandrosta-1,3,5(10)-triene-9,17-dione monooxygenase reductase component
VTEAPARQEHFRAVFGHFPTGVAIITALADDGPRGLTANALCSLSLDPLLVLVCFDNSARTFPLVRERRRFGLNILRADQAALSRVFASKVPEDEKFADVPYAVHDDAPIIDGVLAWLTCDLTETYPGGDHTIGIGTVREMSHAEGEPLAFYRGAYRSLHDAAASDPT